MGTSFASAVTAAFAMIACLASAFAATFESLVGRWAIEVREKETFNGEPYNIRRQIELNRADGTKSVTFRFYDDCRLVGELVNNSTWGVRDGIHWVRCSSIVIGGNTSSCSRYHEYPITSVTPNKVTYYSRERGTAYELDRVDANFELPGSTCLTKAPPSPSRSLPARW
jgi:hypothetical protein